MNREIESFMESLSKRGRNETTVRYYGFVLSRCIDLLEENGYRTSALEIGADEVSYLLGALVVKESTKKLYLTILGMFCNFHTGRNPVLEMGLLWNRAQRNRKFIVMDDLKVLLEKADMTERIILMLGAFTGMRRKEIAELRFEDVREDCILIHGKGHGAEGNVRRQPISGYLYFEILRYKEWRDGLECGDMSEGRLVVFIMEDCKYTFVGRLSNMSNMISRLGARNGIDMSCHSLRRLFCTTLLSEGCPLATVKELMRHTNINTTIECYADPLKLKEKEWSDRCSSVLCAHIATKGDFLQGQADI